jgi:hypothetical protein
MLPVYIDLLPLYMATASIPATDTSISNASSCPLLFSIAHCFPLTARVCMTQAIFCMYAGIIAKIIGWGLALIVIVINLYQVFQTPFPKVCT